MVMIYEPADAATVNRAAREVMIYRLLADIRVDLQVCELEGWDKLEYIERLQDELMHFKTRKKF